MIKTENSATAFPSEFGTGSLCVHRWFELQAAATPDATAVLYRDQTVNYRSLNRAADVVAQKLRACGVKPEVLVGIVGHRSPELVAGLLGVLKAGGAYVALNPADPINRTNYIIGSAGVSVVLAGEHSRHVARLDGIEQIRLDAAIFAPDGKQDDRLPCGATLDNLATVIHTSGSSGRPKGVALSHRAIVSRFQGAASNVPSEPRLQKTSFGLVGHITDLLTPLVYGMPAIIVDDESCRNPSAIAALMKEHRLTRLFLVPSTLRAFLDSSRMAGLSNALRTMSVSGESISPQLVRAFKRKFPETALVNAYGLTETAGTVSMVVLSDHDRVTVGRPPENGAVHILAAELTPVIAGDIGEIGVTGTCLARGYLNDPALTAERFRPNPFREPGSRMYLTADLACQLADGRIQIVGRKDEEVKLHGWRVNLAEIEHLLESDPRVVRAAVVLNTIKSGHCVLEAYVTTKASDGRHLMADLTRRIEQTLPTYMIPVGLHIVSKLPLLPNGKVDRNQLKVLDVAPEAGDRAQSAFEPDLAEATSGIQRSLKDVWSDVLDVVQIGIHDNFFEVGGDSVLAVQAVSRLQDVFGPDVTVRTLIENPTINTLAAHLKRLRRSRSPEASSSTAKVFEPPDTIDRILARQRSLTTTWSGVQRSPDSFLFTLNSEGTKPGLFWCFQSYFEHRQLAAKLGPDQPVHGMRSGHLIMEYEDRNVTSLAAYYASEIVQVQPEGPLFIGGNCQGAIIAQAIASHLEDLNRSVALLLLMEARRFRLYPGPVALLFGRQSHFNPYRSRRNPETTFAACFPGGFAVSFIEGAHGHFFREENVESLGMAVQEHLARKTP